MMNSAKLKSQRKEKNPQLSEAINTLKFFDYRLRKNLKSRKEISK